MVWPIVHQSAGKDNVIDVQYPNAPYIKDIYLQNWVIDGVNVGIHIPAPWFAYGICMCFSLILMSSIDETLIFGGKVR